MFLFILVVRRKKSSHLVVRFEEKVGNPCSRTYINLTGKVIDDVFLLLGFGRICRSPWTGSRQPQYQDPLREAQEKSNSGKNKV
jgi:hypothetical protein